MLTIALAGSLAGSRDALAGAPIATAARWGVVAEGGLPHPDLVLALRGDSEARGQLDSFRRRGSLGGSIVSEWDALPEESGLDFAVQSSLREVYGFVVGYTDRLHEICRWVRAAAHPTSSALAVRTLIIGETGTGKELIARAIHCLGDRQAGPFLAVNCGAIHPDLAASELFGHFEGSFSGATKRRAGAFASAGQGVLFLDEVGELSSELQASLLRALETSTYKPVGGDQAVPLLAQVVAATNRPLDEAVKSGKFRADLYFRLAHLTIPLPPLRDRRVDLDLLIESLLAPHGFSAASLGEGALRTIHAHSWPGNIRQLRSALERFVIFRASGLPTESGGWLELPEGDGPADSTTARTLAALREDFDRRVLTEVLARSEGDTARAARELGITQRSVYNLANRYGVALRKKP